MTRKTLPDLALPTLLLLLPLLLFAPVALGSKTLLPADILFQFEPYRTAAGDFGATFPQNHLVADLILENYAWKHFLKEALQNRELPLWDPYIFAGHPFLANGQHSALYPLSVIFYVLPLWRAYGVFTWLQLGLAGIFAYLFARVLGIRPLGGLVAGITFQFSGFMVVSVVHPMIIAGASWLPFILAMVELAVQQRPALGGRPTTLPWALLGALGLGCQMLAGHAENTYFVLLVTALYAGWRLISRQVSETSASGSAELTVEASVEPSANRRVSESASQRIRGLIIGAVGSWRPVVWLAVMVALGLALGAVQFVPLYEVVSRSFRGGITAASLEQVRGWAYPWRRLITFAIPNFFGSPAHHSYFDLFTWRWTPAPDHDDGRYIYWGIKNYVEGGAYVGLLPLFLAAIAIVSWLKPYVSRFTFHVSHFTHHATRNTQAIPFFTLLSLFSLACIFGTPLYALVYALPGMRQSHSPFRWVFPLTLSVAVLAGFGVEAVQRSGGAGGQGSRGARGRGGKGAGEQGGRKQEAGSSTGCATHHTQSRIRNVLLLGTTPSLVSVLAGLAFWGGVATLTGLVLSRPFFAQLEPLMERAFLSLAKAPEAFPDHRAFYSYEFKWMAISGLLLAATGVILRLSRSRLFHRRRCAWQALAVGLLMLDFATFGMGFNPAVDPAVLDYTPPVIDFLRQDTSLWRYATFTPTDAESGELQTTKTMNANVGMFYGLQAIDGYDSLFTRQYAEYMQLIEPQGELLYNRIASFHRKSSLDSPLTDLLNVKYVITEVEIDSPKYELVYQDQAVRVYENLEAMPRAFTLPIHATIVTEDVAEALRTYDPRHLMILEAGSWKQEAGSEKQENTQHATRNTQHASHTAQPVTSYTINEVLVNATVSEPRWLVLTDSYFPGWKAFVRPQGTGDEAEQEVEIYRVDGNFRGVLLEPGAWTVRFKYSPDSVKVGAFISFTAGMTLLFLTGLYLWRFFYREEDDASAVRRVAKNTLAPTVLSLFNRVIDFAFAMLMARILGPRGMGRYFTAVSIYLWFDTLASFGLDMYLMREVARDRGRARQTFANTTALRLLLFAAVIPFLTAFLTGRQTLRNPLTSETVWVVVLLYAGLLPLTVANSLTALFRALEKSETPAAIETVTTIVRVTLQTLALVGGLGIVGLAGASILTNTVTMAILVVLAWRLIWTELPTADVHLAWPLQRTMLFASWPLMASLLLQSLFTGANVVLLQYFQGDQAVGWYNAASKWVMNMLNIVPSLFTFAVFPIMSRQADEDRGRLRRSYRLSVKLLTMVALPTAVIVTLLATPLVEILSGAQFLPHGAIALRLLVWSILFGWINSLTNYVLFALNRQRYVVLASGARVIFAVVANVLLAPTFSYIASAWIIIGGELLLALLFYADLRRQLGAVAWGRMLARPGLAGLAMGATAWVLAGFGRPLAALVCLIVYFVALVGLRALTPDELDMLAPLLPEQLRRALLT